MELKGRLKAIADMVPKCEILSDIGTDHAYIPIHLMAKERCTKAVAADVNPGPLKAAKENIQKHGFEEEIETRLGSGLTPIEVDEADVIVIAGMGGELIKTLLGEEFEKAKAARLLVLQPMNHQEILRGWLRNNSFKIVDEELAQEGNKIYNIMTAKWSSEKECLNEFYDAIGKRLVEKRHPLLKTVLQRKTGNLHTIINEMKKKSCIDEGIVERYHAEMEFLKGIMDEIQGREA